MIQPEDDLSRFQKLLAETFFGLPEAEGFLLAGGAGLIAHGLIHRRTQDLDLFTAQPHTVIRAHEAFRHAAIAREWTVAELHASPTFVRVQVSGRGDERTLIDVAVDSPSILPPTVTVLGPTVAPPELAARKLLALFDRAEARDFADVYELLRSYDRDETLRMAQSIDAGFDTGVFAQMLKAHRRFTDDRIPLSAADLAPARQFFDHWSQDLADSGS